MNRKQVFKRIEANLKSAEATAETAGDFLAIAKQWADLQFSFPSKRDRAAKAEPVYQETHAMHHEPDNHVPAAKIIEIGLVEPDNRTIDEMLDEADCYEDLHYNITRVRTTYDDLHATYDDLLQGPEPEVERVVLGEGLDGLTVTEGPDYGARPDISAQRGPGARPARPRPPEEEGEGEVLMAEPGLTWDAFDEAQQRAAAIAGMDRELPITVTRYTGRRHPTDPDWCQWVLRFAGHEVESIYAHQEDYRYAVRELLRMAASH